MPTLRIPPLRRPKKTLPPDAVVPPRRRAIAVAQSCILILLLVVVIGAWRSGRGGDPAEVASLAPTVPPVAAAPPTPAPTTSPSTTLEPPPSTIGPIDVEPGTYDLAAALAAEIAPGAVVRAVVDEADFVSERVSDAAGLVQLTMTRPSTGEVFGTWIFDPAGQTVYVQGPVVQGLITPPALWASIPQEASESLLGDVGQRNAAAAVAALEVGDPNPIGVIELDGTKVMAYLSDLERDDVAALTADELMAVGAGAMGSIDRLELRYFVTSDNRLVRLETSMDIGDNPTRTVRTVVDLLPVPDPPITITIPDPATVQALDPAQLDGALVQPASSTPATTAPVATAPVSTAPPASALD